MTAAIADGGLPLHHWPDRPADVWGDPLRAGLARRDPLLGPLGIVAGGPPAIGDDVGHLREQSRPMQALYFGGTGPRPELLQ